MTITKTYKYKLKPSKKQKEDINSWINTCRAVYNLSLEAKNNAYSKGVVLSKFDLIKQLRELRANFLWIKNAPSDSLQDVIERADKAYQSFFRGGGFPKFARKARYNSLTFKRVLFDKKSKSRVKLPKLGSVRYVNSRPLEGELRRAIITRVNNQYFISIVTKQEMSVSLAPNDNQVGVDVGISFWASLSNGTQIENPRHTKKYESQLRLENRSLARKAKGSNNRTKQRLVVAKLHTKISNVRKDFQHKQSTLLINSFGFIAIEDLKVKNMVRFSKLSKHIADAGWRGFRTMLEYKAAWYGSILVAVDPKYTSQTCNNCGEVDKLSRISQSKFVCTSCGVESNADINAAKNILDRASSNLRERKAVA